MNEQGTEQLDLTNAQSGACLGKEKRDKIMKLISNERPMDNKIKDILMNTYLIQTILDDCYTAFENELEKHSDPNGDDKLFEFYQQLVVSTVISQDFLSLIKSYGQRLLEKTTEFESKRPVSINKSQLYLGLSLNSIHLNDTINGTVFWELHKMEEKKRGQENLPLNSHSVINPINHDISQNNLYKILATKYPSIVENFDILLPKLPLPEQSAYLSAGIRYRSISYWLNNDFTDMTKHYGQELINTLCILCEASLKNINGVTKTMMGDILNNNLRPIAPNISNIIGYSNKNPKTGLFLTYPNDKNNYAVFNKSFQNLVLKLKKNNLSEDELKAYSLYAAYLLRNNSLHDFNPSLVYFNDRDLFLDAIGLLFSSVSSIINLKK
jgi:hypothetical protein